MRKFLTAKQRFVFNFVRQEIYEGLPPTIYEIGEHCGFSSIRANDVLHTLRKKGYLDFGNDRRRSILLLPPYKDDTRYSLIVDSDLPQFNLQKGDFLLIDTGKPVSADDLIFSTQGQIKRFATGDTAFGKVVSCIKAIG